jgi:sugar lactone lactonase YvrE
MNRKLLVGLLASLVAACAYVGTASANHSDGDGRSFTFLQPGFTQDLYGTHADFADGVAFAPDGDPLIALGRLARYDSQGVEANTTGDQLHPLSALPSGTVVIGITNHPDGTIYANQGSGVTNHDANTGALLRGPFGPAGNGLGIAVDPQTGNIVYADNSCNISFVNSAFTTSGTFSNVGGCADGIYFDPTGNFLFLASGGGVRVVKRDGSLVQDIAIAGGGCCSDGMAFHADTPKFLLSNNTDGTITRYDFPGDDYTKAPVQTTFASGGFRGDLANVGPDGCLYLSQAGTRVEDDTVSGDGSLVRICGGFAPPPGAGTEGPPGDPTCSDGIDNDGDGKVDAADPDCGVPAGCRMAGVGGYHDQFNSALVVSKGDSLSSDTSKPIAPPNSSLPQHFHLAWGPTSHPKQHIFKMTKLSQATCIDTAGVDPGQGQKIDTFLADGEGTLDGVPGFNFTARLIDKGEPGSGKDTVHENITKKSDGSLVFATKGTLSSGNQDSKDGQ